MAIHPLDSQLIRAAALGDAGSVERALAQWRGRANGPLGRILSLWPWAPKGPMARLPREEGGATAFIAACDNGRLECAKALMEQSDPWAVDAHGRSGAELAARGRFGAVVELAAMAPAPGTRARAAKASALGAAFLHASRLGYGECARALLDSNRAGEGTRDSLGRDALMAAAREGHAGCVRMLAAAMPRMALRSDDQGRTALMIAAARGDERCVAELMASSDAQARDHERVTAKEHALRHGHTRLAKTLAANERAARLAGMELAPAGLSSKRGAQAERQGSKA